MKYERITMREFAKITGDRIYKRLAKLENKIESGELISTVQSEQGAQEIEFFVKHNAKVRENADAEIERLNAKMVTRDVEVCKEVVKACLQVLRDTRIARPRDDYSLGWNNSIDITIKQLAEKYYIDAEERE